MIKQTLIICSLLVLFGCKVSNDNEAQSTSSNTPAKRAERVNTVIVSADTAVEVNSEIDGSVLIETEMFDQFIQASINLSLDANEEEVYTNLMLMAYALDENWSQYSALSRSLRKYINVYPDTCMSVITYLTSLSNTPLLKTMSFITMKMDILIFQNNSEEAYTISKELVNSPDSNAAFKVGMHIREVDLAEDTGDNNAVLGLLSRNYAIERSANTHPENLGSVADRYAWWLFKNKEYEASYQIVTNSLNILHGKTSWHEELEKMKSILEKKIANNKRL